MKRTVSFLVLLLLLFSLVSCGGLFGEGVEKYTVSLSVDGEVTEITVDGELVLPTDPVKENYLFCGWFYDSACTKPLGTRKIEDGDTLYAGFTLDYGEIINRVADEAQRAGVTVYSTSYNKSFIGSVTDQCAANGSGVIFKETPDAYFVLTNCHVVERMEGYSYVSYRITDVYENEYESVSLVFASAEHDLAVLKFRKMGANLSLINLADASPKIGEDVIAISQPKGQKNTMTVGKCVRIDTASVDDSSSNTHVTFPVIYHDSPVDHGSSGGMLLNSELELCGVIFAVAYEKESEDFVAGLSIPIEKVKEFLAEVK